MKLKTKFEKHAIDDEKRKNALKEKVKAKTNQSEIIKQALSTSNLHQGLGKKIIFEDGENVDKSNGLEKPALFDENSSDEEKYEIQEKSQFRGKKGFELLKLQSTYGNDDRFKIDERFLEESEPEEENSEKSLPLESKIITDEKRKEIELLDDLLGKSSASKKPKKRTFEMIRYDASNKDHEKYEVKQDQPETAKSEAKKKKKNKKFETPQNNLKPAVNVSNEKFYEVSKNIKDSFKAKASDSEGFSLLQTYSHTNNTEENDEEDDDDNEEENEGIDGESSSEMEEKSLVGEKTVDTNSSNSSKTNVDKQGDTEKSVAAVAKGVWKESFFFTPDDSRLQEGFEFINKKNSSEAVAAAENYDVTRKKLREIIRVHNKKMLSKKNPFKNKVGGMSKLQMGTGNSKNKGGLRPKRVISHKKGRPKMNPAGRKF